MRPPVTSRSGWRRYSSDAATPKLPPPPRSAQNRSGSDSAVTSSTSPSALTSSTESRLSAASPWIPISHPRPPPSVSPAIPVVEIAPPVTARPCTAVSRLNSDQRTPPCARIVCARGSTYMPFISARSIITLPSLTLRPATLCPPPRTEISSSASRAKRTAAATSAAPRQTAMSAGRRSTRPLWTSRASSYRSSPDCRTAPERLPENAVTRSTSRTATVVMSLLPVRDGRASLLRGVACVQPAGGDQQLVQVRHLAGGVAPRAAHDRVGVDEERRALRNVAQPAVLVCDAEAVNCFRVPVREQRELEVERLAPRDVRPCRVSRDTHRLDAGSLELPAPVTQELHLVRSGGRPIEEVEEQQLRALADEVAEPRGLVRRRPDRRVRNRLADLEHRGRLLRRAAPPSREEEGRVRVVRARELAAEVGDRAHASRERNEKPLARGGPVDQKPLPVRRPHQVAERAGRGEEAPRTRAVACDEPDLARRPRRVLGAEVHREVRRPRRCARRPAWCRRPRPRRCRRRRTPGRDPVPVATPTRMRGATRVGHRFRRLRRRGGRSPCSRRRACRSASRPSGGARRPAARATIAPSRLARARPARSCRMRRRSVRRATSARLRSRRGGASTRRRSRPRPHRPRPTRPAAALAPGARRAPAPHARRRPTRAGRRAPRGRAARARRRREQRPPPRQVTVCCSRWFAAEWGSAPRRLGGRPPTRDPRESRAPLAGVASR